MAFLQKTIRKSTIFLKCFSLLLGYALWNVFSQPYKIETTLSLPLFFYNTNKDTIITAPETTTVSLFGTRSELFKTLAKGSIQCDASEFTEGIQTVHLASQNIFLPETVRLVHYTPQTILITIAHTKKDN